MKVEIKTLKNTLNQLIFDFPLTLNVSKAKIYISGTFWLGFIDDIETTQTYKPGIYVKGIGNGKLFFLLIFIENTNHG